MYKVLLSPGAEELYARAERPLAKKLARCLEQLEREPRRHPNIRALKGPLAGCYRYRVGDFRVVYSIDDTHREVHVAAIAHRREAYD